MKYTSTQRREFNLRLAPDFVGVASIANKDNQSHFFLTLSGFDTARTIAQTTQVNGLDLDDFESTQVWYESTKIPAFIVHRPSQITR